MRSIFAAFFLIFSVTAQAGSEEIILTDINSYRMNHHLPALKMNSILSAEAKKHSIEMASGDSAFGHSGFGGRQHRIFQHFQQSRAMAENVAYVYQNERRAVALWVNSAGHRRNILGRYSLTGIGIAYDKKGRVYLTQIFMR